MRVRKRTILVDSMRNSFLIITLILIIYSVSQLVAFLFFTYEYEKDLLKSRYKEISNLSKDINIEISEDGFYEYITKVDKSNEDEYIRIFSKDKIYYSSNEEVLNEINLTTSITGPRIASKIVDSELYIIFNDGIDIDNQHYNIQIIRENDMFQDFIETSLPILIVSFLLGILLSVIGSVFLSRKFVNRLKILTSTINEIRENGIDKRAEISEVNDEIDKVNVVFNSMMNELEEAFNEQSRFVSDASHELKTPLTALQGHLSMLKRWGKNDKDRLEKSLDICLKEIERLKKLVNDMLFLSKVEKTEINLEELEEINPSLIINDVIEQFSILNSNVNYKVNIQEGLKVKIDANDLKQLLIIFIDNSIKYNNKDKIKIHIALVEENNSIKLEVRDNGIGIPSEEINNVMKRFYKVDKSRVNNNSFGIGLSIAKRIINNYKAKINIESQIDKCTAIKVYFNK